MWRGDPEAAFADDRAGDRGITGSANGRATTFACSGMGMRAAADRAEVARARRDAAAEQAAIEDGHALWDALAPFVSRAIREADGPGCRRDRDRDHDDRRRATAPPPRAVRGRLGGGGADAGTRAATPISSRTAAGASPRRASTTATGPARRPALGEAHAIATRLGAAPLRAAIEGLAARARLDLAGEPVARRPSRRTLPAIRSA